MGRTLLKLMVQKLLQHPHHPVPPVSIQVLQHHPSAGHRQDQGRFDKGHLERYAPEWSES